MGIRQLMIGVLFLIIGARAEADVVKNLSTGIVDATSIKIASDSPDLDYTIAAGGTGGLVGQQPVARLSPLGGGWLADAASTGSRWIVLNSGNGPEGITVGPGTYEFQTHADLTGFNPSTAFLSGISYSADNKLTNLVINGISVYSQNFNPAQEYGNFTALSTVLGQGDFHSGVNTITFEVFNSGTGSDPMGLRVEGSVVATVPEPILLSLALPIGLSLMARRVRR